MRIYHGKKPHYREDCCVICMVKTFFAILKFAYKTRKEPYP